MFSKVISGAGIIFLISALSCSRKPYAASNKVYRKQVKLFANEIRQPPPVFVADSATTPTWIGTTNFNLRKPNFVIIHHTAQDSCGQTLRTFTLTRTQVSAHYVVCKDGTVHHMLSDYLRAWHAGIAKWGNLTDVNSSSIGIEIDNNGFEPFTGRQMNSLLQLLDTLKHRYAIPTANFIGHGDIAPVRKNDPSIYFPWKSLADRGFGLWYGDTASIVVPENFNSLVALRIIGYDTRDSVAAVRAFKRHFMQDTSALIGEPDRKLLFDLERKSM